jgi:hypothetical protein
MSNHDFTILIDSLRPDLYMCCLVILFHLDLTSTEWVTNMNDNIVLTEVAYTDNGLSILQKNLLEKKLMHYTKEKQSKGKRKWNLHASEHCSKLQSQPDCASKLNW